MVDHRPPASEDPPCPGRLVAVCSVCNGSLHPRLAFCGACGAIVNPCQQCGEALVAGDTSCPACCMPVDPGSITTPLPAEQTEQADSESLTAWTGVLDRLQAATLGEFEVVRELGRGGMAAVYLARDIALDRDVAIKVMSPLLAEDARMVERFRREARTGAGLKHPNVGTVHRVLDRGGLHFFVMDFIRGPSLETIINTTGQLPITVAQAWIHQIGSGLSYAHRRGVCHRDVKPGNILVSAVDGTAVVTDFGIAKILESPHQTQTGAVVGTPFYMPPEQVLGRTVTPAADQYSLGIVFYEMLTGAPPFTGTTYLVMHAHATKSPRPVRERRPDCPKEVSDAVARMLAKDPAHRWPTLSDAIAALGGSMLKEDDPLREELVRFATPRALDSEVVALRVTKCSPPERKTEPLDAATVAAITSMSSLPTPDVGVPATRLAAKPARLRRAMSPGVRRAARLALAVVALTALSRAVLSSLEPRVKSLASSKAAPSTAVPHGTQASHPSGGADRSDAKEPADTSSPPISTIDPRPTTLARPVRITVAQPEPLRVGERATLRAKLVNAPPHITLPVLWESSAPAVATVDAFTGTVIATGAGEATITAHVAGREERTQVVVVVRSATSAQGSASLDISNQPVAQRTVDDRPKGADVLLESATAAANAMRAHDGGALNDLLGGTAPGNLLDAVKTPRFEVGDVQTDSVDVNGQHGSLQYTIHITYLTAVGTTRARALVFQAAAQKSADGWRVERVRLEGGWR